MIVSKHLKDYSRTVEGKQQLIIAAFSRALELIPRQLADNAGFDNTDVMNKLRQKHALWGSSQGPCWWGVDLDTEGVTDTMERGVWEPANSKANSYASATEAAALILSVDETVTNKQSEKPMGGGGGRGGMAGGRPMSAALGGAGMRAMGRGRGVRVMQGRGGK